MLSGSLMLREHSFCNTLLRQIKVSFQTNLGFVVQQFDEFHSIVLKIVD